MLRSSGTLPGFFRYPAAIGFAWPLLGLCLAFAWPLLGLCLAFALALPCLGILRDPLGCLGMSGYVRMCPDIPLNYLKVLEVYETGRVC